MSAKVIGTVVALSTVGIGGYFAYAGLSGVQSNLIEQEIEQAIAEFDPQATLEYDSVRSDFLSSSAEMIDANVTLTTGETIHVDRVVGDKSGYVELENALFSTLEGEAISIERVIVHEYDTENEQPTFIRVSAEGVSFEGTAAALGPQVLVFTSLGYSLDNLTADMEFAYRFDETAQQMNASFSQEVTEVGSLSGQIRLGNFDSEDLSMMFGAVDSDNRSDITVLDQLDATLVSMELSYQDDSLVPRVYNFVSTMQQVSVEEVEQMALLFVDQLQTELPEGEFRRQATTAAASFIEEPGSLTVTVAPSTPLPLDAMSQDLSDKRDLDYFINYFGLSIAANTQ